MLSNKSFLKGFSFLLVVLMGTLSKAQEKKTTISFTYYTHDFGNIKEEGGSQSYEFEFTNSGHSDLIIKNVQASCGCTVPIWPKEKIPAGEKGIIKVEFNPINKPGPFNKSLIVNSNASNEAIVLNVTGKVMPKPRKPADDFPDLLGSLRMISRYMNMGEMTTEKTVSKDFYIYNQSDTIVSINSINYNTLFLKVSFESNTILPKSKTKISIVYDPIKKNDFGYVSDKIDVITSDKLSPTKSMFITGVITKYFPKFSDEEMKLKPKAYFDKSNYDFGSIKQGEKVNVVFTIVNNGKEILNIYKVKPSCGCTVADLDKKLLDSGESAKLSITFDTQGKDGVQEKHINIYTNDPSNFNPVITLKAKILKN